MYDAFEHLLKAEQLPHLQNFAHDIACTFLAPEVILRGDMRLLRHIFARFNTSVIDGWSVRGKVSWHSITIESGSCSLKLYLDYANIIIILEQQEADRLAD